MILPIDLSAAIPFGGCVIERADGAYRIALPANDSGLRFSGTPGAPFGFDWRGMTHIVLDVETAEPEIRHVQLVFSETNPDYALSMDCVVFPQMNSRVIFDLKWLDNQLCYPPMKPVTLKICVGGAALKPENVARVELRAPQRHETPVGLIVRSAFLTDEEPQPLPVKETNCDPFGQWKSRDWPGKIHSEAELVSRLNGDYAACEAVSDDGLDRWGGVLPARFEATGWFRTEKKDGRWFLVDPDGCPFYSSGVFGVYPGEPGWVLGVEAFHDFLPPREGRFAEAWCDAGSLELYRRKFSGMFPDDTGLFSFSTANLIRAFGEGWREKWTRLTVSRLRRWGVNTLSMFSDPDFVRDSGMPYVIMLSHFPLTKTLVFREFPDVFAPEYDEACRVFASQLAGYAADPRLVGYFLNNEPTWGFVGDLVLAEKLLEDDRPSFCRAALIDWLRARYGTVDRLNAAWGLSLASFESLEKTVGERLSERGGAMKDDLSEFSALMVRRYAELPARYARTYAPHHLNLGMRFASVRPGDPILTTCSFFDVFSFNCYGFDPSDTAKRVAEVADMPVLVGEFHFGALDRGLPAASLVPVKDQRERGRAYARYMLSLAAQPASVGGHYFAYNDQPLWGRYDGENYQFGFVDICHLPYSEFAEAVSETNRTIRAMFKEKGV